MRTAHLRSSGPAHLLIQGSSAGRAIVRTINTHHAHCTLNLRVICIACQLFRLVLLEKPSGTHEIKTLQFTHAHAQAHTHAHTSGSGPVHLLLQASWIVPGGILRHSLHYTQFYTRTILHSRLRPHTFSLASSHTHFCTHTHIYTHTFYTHTAQAPSISSWKHTHTLLHSHSSSPIHFLVQTPPPLALGGSWGCTCKKTRARLLCVARAHRLCVARARLLCVEKWGSSLLNGLWRLLREHLHKNKGTSTLCCKGTSTLRCKGTSTLCCKMKILPLKWA